MKVHTHLELQFFLLIGTRRDEKLHISHGNRKRWDAIVVVLQSSVGTPS